MKGFMEKYNLTWAKLAIAVGIFVVLVVMLVIPMATQMQPGDDTTDIGKQANLFAMLYRVIMGVVLGLVVAIFAFCFLTITGIIPSKRKISTWMPGLIAAAVGFIAILVVFIIPLLTNSFEVMIYEEAHFGEEFYEAGTTFEVPGNVYFGNLLKAVIAGILALFIIVYALAFMLITGIIPAPRGIGGVVTKAAGAAVLLAVAITLTVFTGKIARNEFTFTRDGGDGKVEVQYLRALVDGFMTPFVVNPDCLPPNSNPQKTLLRLETSSSDWYYWMHWTTRPLNILFYGAFSAVVVFGFGVPALKKFVLPKSGKNKYSVEETRS